jgi:hypothetical protein
MKRSVMKAARLRPSPALVISLVALFVAVGGTAAAASGLISGRQIVNHSIPARKLTAGAIKTLQGKASGAISISRSVPASSSLNPLTAKPIFGVNILYVCDPAAPEINLMFTQASGEPAGGNGLSTADGVTTAVIPGVGYADGFTAKSTLMLDLLGWSGSAYKKGFPVHFNLIGMVQGADGCFIEGLITPGP